MRIARLYIHPIESFRLAILETDMNRFAAITPRSTHIAGFMLAAVMALAVNGTLVFQFNQVATEGYRATLPVIALDPVTVVGRKLS